MATPYNFPTDPFVGEMRAGPSGKWLTFFFVYGSDKQWHVWSMIDASN